jgi:hypothetical protein
MQKGQSQKAHLAIERNEGESRWGKKLRIGGRRGHVGLRSMHVALRKRSREPHW